MVRIGLVENKRPPFRTISPDSSISGRDGRGKRPFFMAETFPAHPAPTQNLLYFDHYPIEKQGV
jgi:hypothetical protein